MCNDVKYIAQRVVNGRLSLHIAAVSELWCVFGSASQIENRTQTISLGQESDDRVAEFAVLQCVVRFLLQGTVR